jgi:TolA-binding protein
MGRGIGPRLRVLAAIVGSSLLAAPALSGDPPAANPQAAERFRAAAVLQARALYDLAAVEYESIEREFVDDPLADRACLQRGICLFQLNRYAEAAAELAPLVARQPSLSAAESEQALAFFGLAKYNLGNTAAAGEREQLLDAAIDALATHLGKFPDGELAPQTAFYHAEALYARGRLDAAVAAYRSMLTKYPAHPQRADALYALGVAQQERRADADAVESFTRFEHEFPQHASYADARARHADALFSLAKSRFENGELPAAQQTVDRLLAEFPESALVPPALALKAQLLLVQSDLAAAEASLEECLARSTHADVSCQARLLRAQVRYQRGNFAGGLADATNVLSHDPQRIEALHLRGLCEAGLGRPADAVKSLNQILAADPHYARADHVLYDLAWAQQAANDPDAATATFARLAAAHPDSQYAAECHFRIGEAQYAAENFAAAAKSYSQACDSSTNDELRDRSLHKLAWCHFQRGEFRAAEDAFDRQIATYRVRTEAARGAIDSQAPLHPLAADAMLMIVECRFQQQQYESALAAFESASSQTSANESLQAMTCVHAAQSAAAMKNWQRAFELADRAIRDFPKCSWGDEARCQRGAALVELGRFEEAEADLNAVIPSHQVLLQLQAEFALGKIQVAKRDNDAAVRTFFKVAYGHGGPAAPAAYHHWQEEAIYAAAEVLENSGRMDAAGKLYQELVDQYPSSPRSTLARQSLDRIMRR